MSTLPLTQSINQLMFNLISKKVRTTMVVTLKKLAPNGVSSKPRHTSTVLVETPELSLLSHQDKKMLRRLIKNNMSTSLLILFINQLMSNFPVMDITTVETQSLSETNGVLSQLEHGLMAQEVIQELISQSHLDKLKPKPDKRNKNSISPSTLLMEFNDMLSGLMAQEAIPELISQSHLDKLMPKLDKKLKKLLSPSTLSMEFKDLAIENGSMVQEVIPELISQCHLDKLMPRPDKKHKKPHSPSTLLMELIDTLAFQLN
jgi:hypothetical protein